jgi:hypothetical protein
MNGNSIIFLDIDEVICIKHTRGTPFRDTDEYGEKFDPICVGQLERIIESTGADIVLSSRWRKDGFSRNLAMWEFRKMPGKLIGATPFKEPMGWGQWGDPELTRGEEIKKWMEVNGYPDRYVIIDDDPNMLDWQKPYCVETKYSEGLTEELADKAIEILNKIKGE